LSLLVVEDLVVEYAGAGRLTRSLDGASLTVAGGEIVAVVGESGSGKSTLASAIGRLPVPGLRVTGGSVSMAGSAVEGLDDRGLGALRRETIGYIFQDPIGTLDPTLKIGAQVALVLGHDRAKGALSGLGLRDVDRVLRSYPHELSGGMAQRVAIGIALARKPRLLIADEPTAALDASIKIQVLDLLVQACRTSGTALLLVTHDLHVVRHYADRTAVMYGGRIVEEGRTEDVLSRPVHPYTVALLSAAIGTEQPGERVPPIGGTPPQLRRRLEACSFAPRCKLATERCRTERPVPRDPTLHGALCHYAGQAAEASVA
jgi:oligopeptide/dipeptide ABC transporter ATP-binding protein